jgi:hypothetical protein
MILSTVGFLCVAALGAATAPELQQEEDDIFFTRIGVTAHELHYAVVRQAFDLDTMEKIAHDLGIAWVAWNRYNLPAGTKDMDKYQQDYEWIDDPSSANEPALYNFHGVLDRIRTGGNRARAVRDILGTTSDALHGHLAAHARDATRLSAIIRHRPTRNAENNSETTLAITMAQLVDDMDLRYLLPSWLSTETLAGTTPDGGLTRETRSALTSSIVPALGGVAAVAAATAAGTWLAIEMTGSRNRAVQAEQLATGALRTSARLGRTHRELTHITLATIEALKIEKYDGNANLRIDRALTIYNHRMTTIETALDQALIGRAAVSAFTEFNLDQVAHDIQLKATQAGMVPAALHISDWLHFEAGFIGLTYGFDVLLHVPIYRPETLMTIFHYHPLPIPLTGGAHLRVTQNGLTHIAINDAQSLFRAMGLAEFTRCSHRGQLYICDFSSVARKAPDDDDEWDATVKDAEVCLFALFTRRFRLARAACLTTIKATPAAMVQLGVNHIASYSADTVYARVVCRQQAAQQHLAATLKGTRGITVPEHCGLDTPTHSFAPTDESFQRSAAQWTNNYDWPTTQQHLLRGMDTIDLAALIAHAASISKDAVSPITIDEAVRLAHARRAPPFNPTGWPAIVMYISLGCIAAAFFLGLTVYRKGRAQFNNMKTQWRVHLFRAERTAAAVRLVIRSQHPKGPRAPLPYGTRDPRPQV